MRYYKTIAAVATASCVIWNRGFGGTTYDLKNLYNAIPSFPSDQGDKATTDAQRSLLTAASYVKTFANIANPYSKLSLAYQVIKDSSYSVTFLDGITQHLTGYKITSLVNPVLDSADKLVHEYVLEQTLDLIKTGVSLTAGAAILATSWNPIPLYMALQDSGFGKEHQYYNSVDAVISTGLTAISGGLYLGSSSAAVQAINYLAPENSAIKYIIPAVQVYANTIPFKLSWNSVALSKLAKIPVIFNNLAKANIDISHAADLTINQGGKYLASLVPNNNELMTVPGAIATFDILGGPIRAKFEGNPTSSSFVRDVVKAAPVAWFWHQGIEIASTGIKYTAANVVAAILKPLCKIGTIFALHKAGTNLKDAGRIGNYACEPTSMMLILAAKDQQKALQPHDLKPSDSAKLMALTLTDSGKLAYIGGEESVPLEIKIKSENSAGISTELYDQIVKSLKGDKEQINLKYAQSQQLWDFIKTSGYPTNEQGITSYIQDHSVSLIERGAIVGLFKTTASDQLGELVGQFGIATSMSGAIVGLTMQLMPAVPAANIAGLKALAPALVSYFTLTIVSEAVMTTLLATPTRVVIDGIDAATKKYLAYRIDPEVLAHKTDIVTEVTDAWHWLFPVDSLGHNATDTHNDEL